MASITSTQLSDDLDFAILDFPVTLTTVLPTASVGVEFSATKTSIQTQFIVEENGREVDIDSAFFINTDGLTTLPSKGWVLDDGTRELKVELVSTDASGLSLRLEMVARRQR